MIKKISIFIIIIALILAIVPINSYATGKGLAEPVIDPDSYAFGMTGPKDSSELTNIANPILGIIYYIGIFISVGALMILGIKYMMGSIEEKAQYKETLLPYAIGAVLLFGGINILRIVYTIVEKTL